MEEFQGVGVLVAGGGLAGEVEFEEAVVAIEGGGGELEELEEVAAGFDEPDVGGWIGFGGGADVG